MSNINKIFKLINIVGFSEKQLKRILVLYSLNKNISLKKALIKNYNIYFGNTKIGLKRVEILNNILNMIETDLEIKYFIFILKLYAIKPLLKQEAKMKYVSNISQNLSHKSYITETTNALYNLILSDQLDTKNTFFLSYDTIAFLKELSLEAKKFQKLGFELNQIFNTKNPSKSKIVF